MLTAIVVGLPALLVGSVIFSVVRKLRGGPLYDPGPRSLREFIQHKRTIIHPDE
jgi:hypothetical protein